MNHPTILSDMARIHQAALLQEARQASMLKHAGVTPSAQPKQLLVVATIIVTLGLVLAGRIG